MTEDIIACNRNFGGLLTVSLCGVSHCDGSYHIRRACSDVHVFEYVIHGEGRILRGGKTLTARAGDIYWLRPGEAHDYFSSQENPWEKIWFNLRGPYVDALQRIFALSRTVFSGCDAYALFREFAALVARKPDSQALTVSVGSKLLELFCLLAHGREGGGHDDADALRLFLDEHVRQDVGLAEMSAFLCRSPSQLNRIFTRKFGLTPTRYLSRQRIKLAKTLLSDTSLSVRQVADELCFADEHYFSNVFKKAVGVGPRLYRRQSAGAPARPDSRG